MWNDRLGRWATRSLQVLIVVALVALAIWALVQVDLLVVPVLIAIILAAAAAPLVGWLRRHGVSPILAAWITLLGGITVLGGIVTLIVFAEPNPAHDALARLERELGDDLLVVTQNVDDLHACRSPPNS